MKSEKKFIVTKSQLLRLVKKSKVQKAATSDQENNLRGAIAKVIGEMQELGKLSTRLSNASIDVVGDLKNALAKIGKNSDMVNTALTMAWTSASQMLPEARRVGNQAYAKAKSIKDAIDTMMIMASKM